MPYTAIPRPRTYPTFLDRYMKPSNSHFLVVSLTERVFLFAPFRFIVLVSLSFILLLSSSLSAFSLSFSSTYSPFLEFPSAFHCPIVYGMFLLLSPSVVVVDQLALFRSYAHRAKREGEIERERGREAEKFDVQ